MAASPGRVLPRSSVKKMMSATVGLVFSMLNLSVTVLSGATGSSVNSLVKNISVMSRTSVAGSPVRDCPLTVAVTSLVVLVWLPVVAVPGTSSVTLNVHEESGESVPPAKVRVVVPLIDEPAPQMSFTVPLVDARPARAGTRVVRSSVNSISVASVGELLER